MEAIDFTVADGGAKWTSASGELRCGTTAQFYSRNDAEMVTYGRELEQLTDGEAWAGHKVNTVASTDIHDFYDSLKEAGL